MVLRSAEVHVCVCVCVYKLLFFVKLIYEVFLCISGCYLFISACVFELVCLCVYELRL